jgi:hypothetical protein
MNPQKPMPGLSALLHSLDGLGAGQQIMLKLAPPGQDDFHAELVRDPRVPKMVALSGGCSRAEGNALPARNRGVIAGFSRACRRAVRAATGRGLRCRARRGHPGHPRSLANLETQGVNRCNSE